MMSNPVHNLSLEWLQKMASIYLEDSWKALDSKYQMCWLNLKSKFYGPNIRMMLVALAVSL